jgi:glycosyltransferase involved in cell wall biosynthesis
MRILWVKLGGLWPLTSGGRLLSYHVLARLAQRHRLTLVTTHGPQDDLAGLSQHLPWCEQIVSVPHAPVRRGSARLAVTLARSWLSPLPLDLLRWRVGPLARAVEHLLATRAFDLCLADVLFAVPNLPRRLDVPLALLAHNVEHVIWRRLAETERSRWRRAVLDVEWRKVRAYELHACRRADVTLTVSDVDRAVLAAAAPGAVVRSIPTGVDTAYFTPNGDHEAPGRVVFAGSMDWYPNEDAALHFMHAILPLVRREVAEASFQIVGRNPSRTLRAAAARAGVEVTGTVPDIRPYLGSAAVCVVPLRVGSGTRLKIFEALAMGKAVVSTRVGAEGLPVVDGVHYVAAESPAEFAATVAALLRDPARRGTLGEAGRRLVEERYSWTHVAREVERRCEDLVGARRCA